MELVSDVGQVESRFSPFGDSVSVSARFEHGLHSRGLLGDEAQVEAQFGTFGDSATLDARLVLGLRRMCHRLRKSIGGT
jgi:hypothetical protein